MNRGRARHTRTCKQWIPARQDKRWCIQFRTYIYRIYKSMAYHRQIGLVGTDIYKYYNFHNSCYSFSTSIYEELQLLASNSKKEKKKKKCTLVCTTTDLSPNLPGGLLNLQLGDIPARANHSSFNDSCYHCTVGQHNSTVIKRLITIVFPIFQLN